MRGEGIARPSRPDLERRTREIAETENRPTAAQARGRARADFLDRDLPPTTTEDAATMQSMSRDPSDPVADRGRQIPEYTESDAKTTLERLALEGVEEAQREQMRAARAIEASFRSPPRRHHGLPA